MQRSDRARIALLLMKRRLFLTATVLGATEVGAAPPNFPASMLHPGEVVEAYGRPSRFVSGVVRRPSNVSTPALTPLADQLSTLTPSGLCFVRNHAGVPTIDPREHRLLVHGMVRKPISFELADLLRFPAVTRFSFLECAGNSAPGWQRLGEGVQYSHGLLSCCQWTGVPLRAILDEAGVTNDGRWIVAEGADAAAYDRSLPLQHILDEALLVYGQNGEALRPEQGFPLRLLVPGFEGSANVKWLRRIKVVASPVYSREETAQYATLRADGSSEAFDFIMNVKSVITTPSPGRALVERGFYTLRGFAWSGRGRIRRVEITLNGGATWSDARLIEPLEPKSLARFEAPLRWDGSELVVASRATDETGNVQPNVAAFAAHRGPDRRYHINAIASWRVGRDGSVTVADA